MFNQTTEYALRAMTLLGEDRVTLTPTVTIAEQAGIPQHYLAKVLQHLANAGLIVGRRGVGGGYRLAKPASEIPLIEIIRIFAPMQEGSRRAAVQKDAPVPLDHLLNEFTHQALSFFGSRTLADVSPSERPMDRDPKGPDSGGGARTVIARTPSLNGLAHARY